MPKRDFKSRLKLFSVAVAGFFMCVISASSLSQEPQTDTASEQQTPVVPQIEQDNADQSSSTVPSDLIEEEFVFDPLSARSWMQRLIRQVQSTSFEMVYVVSANKRETLPYMWRRGEMPDGSVIEQLSLLNGPGFEQVVHQGKVSIFEPGYPPYSVPGSAVQSPIPQAFIYDGIDINNAYDSLLMGRNRISGRMAQQIRVISKDKTRFGYHLWLDEETGLLLKLDMYDLEGALLEQIQTTQLTVSDSVNQVFTMFSVDQLPQVTTRVGQAERDLMWRASYLPKGMKVLKQDVHRIERTGQVTEYMLLSDGLVDVSVYVLPANDAISEDMSIATGSHAVVSKTDGRIQVTVVGEIPVTTADKIANSIVIVEQSND